MTTTGQFSTVPARLKYSRFECDHCHKPVGYDGRVRERHEDDCGVLVWAAICPKCAADGKRL